MGINIAVNGTFLMKPITGVQRYTHELLKALWKGGFNNLVIIAPHEYEKDEYLGFEVIRDKKRFLLKNNWWLWEQTRLPLIYQKYTKNYLLWSPTNTGPIGITNQIVTIHDAAVFAGPEWFSQFGRTYYRAILPILGKRSKHIITVSNFSKGELIRYKVSPENKIAVISPGVSDIFYRGKNIERKQPSNLFNILNVGSRDPRKNVKRLVEAWNQIKPNLKKEKKLILVGGYNRGFSNEGLLANNLPLDVEIVGYKTDNELLDLYKNTYLFVYPSLYEGFGLPPLESMASGIPVAVSNIASLPEVCGDAAVYFNPYNVNDIANKIEDILSGKVDLNILIKKGFEQVKKYTWEKSAEKFIELLAYVKA